MGGGWTVSMFSPAGDEPLGGGFVVEVEHVGALDGGEVGGGIPLNAPLMIDAFEDFGGEPLAEFAGLVKVVFANGAGIGRIGEKGIDGLSDGLGIGGDDAGVPGGVEDISAAKGGGGDHGDSAEEVFRGGATCAFFGGEDESDSGLIDDVGHALGG